MAPKKKEVVSHNLRRFPRELYERLKYVAFARNIFIIDAIIEAVTDWCEKHKDVKPGGARG